MIRTIIIDDEEQVRSTTRYILGEIRPDVEIIGEARDVKTGIALLNSNKPDLLLLDIELPDGTGFDILERLGNIDFKLIFITAFQEYAVKAFKFSAVDYIMKPVSAHELSEAIDKVVHLLQAELSLKLNTLISNNQAVKKNDKRLVLKTTDKIHILRLDQIMHLESDQSYCHFFLNDGQKITVSKPLKEYDELLCDYDFLRIHKSHMVNLEFIRRFDRAEGGYVIMKDESRIPVSFRKKDELLQILENL